MGRVANIDYGRFPAQRSAAGTITDAGHVVRWDAEHPHRKVVVLGGVVWVDGRPPTPRQGSFLGRRCLVGFHFGRQTLAGIIVRDDAGEDPIEVLCLEDGRYVLSTECQYLPMRARGEGDV